MDADFVKQAVFTFIRYAAAPVVAWISLKFGVTESETTAVLVGGITYAIMFVWALANKWRYEDKVSTALDVRAGTTKTELKDIIANR